MPGVQNPHWSPWLATNACWIGCRSSAPELSASIVVTSRPSTSAASTEHDLTVSPSSTTVQAPQLPVEQPTCVPVRPSCSRRSPTRFCRVSISSRSSDPFTVTPIVIRISAFLPLRQRRLHRAAGVHARHRPPVIGRRRQVGERIYRCLARRLLDGLERLRVVDVEHERRARGATDGDPAGPPSTTAAAFASGKLPSSRARRRYAVPVPSGGFGSSISTRSSSGSSAVAITPRKNSPAGIVAPSSGRRGRERRAEREHHR